MNPTLKRLEEIEAVCHEDAHLVGWLCARLRDALEVLESREETIEQALWLFKLRGKYPAWVDAYHRLFGGKAKRG